MGINAKAFKSDLTKSETSTPSDGEVKTVDGKTKKYNKFTGKWKTVKNSKGKIVNRSGNTAYG